VKAQIVEGHRAGCIGRIVQLHAETYAAIAGFGVFFEAKVARELAAFCEGYRAGRDGLWLAVADGAIEGSIAIDGAHADRDGAHLRWFVVSSARRGAGLGDTLLDHAMAFCRARGYRSVFLWTFAGLDAARHLYEKQGFRLVEERRGAQWGTEVLEQRFEWRDAP
jgi:ribosomal protein S18 acetylase RimI-like enzyme